MATHDYVIANGTGAAVRSDLNGALAAIVSQNSSATEPSPSYAYQRWADTTAGVMKMRNGANNAWITLYQLDGEWSTIAFENGTAAAPSIYFKDSGTDTGIYSPGADQVGISTGGTSRFEVSTTAATSTLPVVHPLGAVGTPSITFTGDLNTGIWSPAADTIAFSEGGDEAMRIDSSRRLLVGTSTSAALYSRLQVAGGLGGEPGIINLLATATPSAGNTGVGIIQFRDPSGNLGASINAESDAAWTSGSSHPSRLVFSTTADGGNAPTTSPSAMTINSGQEVLIGYSTDNGAYKLQVNSQIFATSATIATSDGRYKENVATLNDCVDLVKALRPVSFDWKHQEPITRINEKGEIVVVREAHNFPDGTQVGFIAQEVQEVLAEKPWLTSVIKQNVRPAVNDSDGNELAPEEEFFGIAEGNLVAVLTSALKDAIGRIESLEAEVAALKA